MVGGGLQLAVQLPAVLELLGRGARLSLGRGDAHVREVVRNFLPVVAGRGVVQLSAYVDTLIASWLPGAVAAFGYAQVIYTLPVSLFGMAVSAASLPSMSADAGVGDRLHAQTEAGLRAIAFPVVPSVAAFLALGDVICAALFQTGRFDADDVRYVWIDPHRQHGGPARGHHGAALLQRLLRPARHPHAAALRGAARGADRRARGLLRALPPRAPRRASPLRRGRPHRVGRARRAGSSSRSCAAASAGASASATCPRGCCRGSGAPQRWPSLLSLALKFALPPLHPILRAVLVLGVFGGTYLGVTLALGVAEASRALGRARRLLRL